MTRQRSFETAAARRRANPIVWTIDDREVRLRSSVDLLDLAELIEALEAPMPSGTTELKYAAEKRRLLLQILRQFIEPDSEDSLAAVERDLDFAILMEMLQDLIAEYSGQANPTPPPSSSGGSPATGSSSTAGSRVAESTPPRSRRTGS